MNNSITVTIQLVAVWMLLFISNSCTWDHSGISSSTGKINEILVVTNDNTLWEGRMGDSIRALLEQYQEGLPQPEQIFDLVHIPAKDFGTIYQKHHNIFIVDINKQFQMPVSETKEDVWSIPQRIIKITAPDEQIFYREFEHNKSSILDLFNENEIRRVGKAYISNENYKIKKTLQEKLNITLTVPGSYYLATEGKDFAWIRREAEQYSQGLLVYTFPYSDTSAFTIERILHLRDSIAKKYIPGPSNGSYMKSSAIYPPSVKRINFKNRFAIEMRGLWEVHGDFMGGPFINYTFVDEKTNRVITIDGYVYDPSQDQKNLLRQVEAIIHTFE